MRHLRPWNLTENFTKIPNQVLYFRGLSLNAKIIWACPPPRRDRFPEVGKTDFKKSEIPTYVGRKSRPHIRKTL